MIEYRRGDKVLVMSRPKAGRWMAMVGDREVCEVEVTAEIIHTWGRLCALDVAGELPNGCDPVVVRWLSSGNSALRAATLAASPPTARGAESAAMAAAMGWAAMAAAMARSASWDDGDAVEARQRAHLHRLIWMAHGEKLTTRERIELSRDLRCRGEEEAAAAVLPDEPREVAR